MMGSTRKGFESMREGPSSTRACTRSLVAGHYQPLADNPGVAPEPDQTRSSAVGSENTWENP